MPRDRKRLLGYVETIQLIIGVTDKLPYSEFIDGNPLLRIFLKKITAAMSLNKEHVLNLLSKKFML